MLMALALGWWGYSSSVWLPRIVDFPLSLAYFLTFPGSKRFSLLGASKLNISSCQWRTYITPGLAIYH
jgi:hypothetical protein